MSNLSVNAIRFLGIDAINKANSGHPGVVMGAAPMAYSLFTKQLRINPAQPNWINRDRFPKRQVTQNLAILQGLMQQQAL